MNINSLWLLLIIPFSILLGILIGFFSAIYFYIKKIKKQASEMKNRMGNSSLGGMLKEINKDPDFRKKLEELEKEFGK